MFLSVLCMLLKAFVSCNIFRFLSLQGKRFLGARFFFFFFFMLAKAPCLNSKREEEIGQVKGSRGGGGERDKKMLYFSPLPMPPFLLSP